MNMNSPSVQYMMGNNPPPPYVGGYYGPGTMIEYQSPPPAMERVNPTDQNSMGFAAYVNSVNNATVQIGQPMASVIGYNPYAAREAGMAFPDPKGMVTAIGQQNTGNALPVYNFTGAASPYYMDRNQPTAAGTMVPGMPIPGYSNPYMGYGVPGAGIPPQQGFGYSTADPKSEWCYRYSISSPEDRWAMDYGFDNVAALNANQVYMKGKINKMVMKYEGYSDEEIADYDKRVGEKVDELLKESEKQSKVYDPFDLSRYNLQSNPQIKCTMKVKIMKGDDVIIEVGGDKDHPHRIINPNAAASCERNMQEGAMQREMRARQFEAMYQSAPERKMDHMSIIDFFNQGWGELYYDQWLKDTNSYRHNITRLYDPDNFHRVLIKKFGTPAERLKAIREESRRSQIPAIEIPTEQEKKDKEEGVVRGEPGFFPGGVPIEEDSGILPEEGSFTVYDPMTNSTSLKVPESMKQRFDPRMYENIKIDPVIQQKIDKRLRGKQAFIDDTYRRYGR